MTHEEYQTCRLQSADRLLGVCATPGRQSSISIVIRNFSPVPNAIEWHPGHSYYVIATSTGTQDGINNTDGGLCASHNMRLKFDVQKLPGIVISTVESGHDEACRRIGRIDASTSYTLNGAIGRTTTSRSHDDNWRRRATTRSEVGNRRAVQVLMLELQQASSPQRSLQPVLGADNM